MIHKVKITERLVDLKENIKKLAQNFEVETAFEEVKKPTDFNGIKDSPQMKELVTLVRKFIALLPEVEVLEKKFGTLADGEKDLLLSQITDSLKEK